MLESDGADRPWEGQSDGSELGVGTGLGGASSGWMPLHRCFHQRILGGFAVERTLLISDSNFSIWIHVWFVRRE